MWTVSKADSTNLQIARICETDHEKAVFDIIQIVHKLYRGIILPHPMVKKS